ncbi:MAG: DUF5615 family PIN-like protein, partial [Rhabdochlamydiaceae bacterium]
MEVYFDENISFRIAYAMAELLGNDPEIKIFATRDVTALGKGASDLHITKYVAQRGGIIITQDRDYRSQRAIADLCKEYN